MIPKHDNPQGLILSVDAPEPASTKEENWEIVLRPATSGRHLACAIANARPTDRCPVCQSIIYSRRHALCGVCARPLPSQYLFTAAEAQRIERLLETERQQHRQWISRAFA